MHSPVYSALGSHRLRYRLSPPALLAELLITPYGPRPDMAYSRSAAPALLHSFAPPPSPLGPPPPCSRRSFPSTSRGLPLLPPPPLISPLAPPSPPIAPEPRASRSPWLPPSPRSCLQYALPPFALPSAVLSPAVSLRSSIFGPLCSFPRPVP